MNLKKCPRCNLNYMRPGETLCDVCKRELGKLRVKEETVMICPECNENPVVNGEELCLACLRERMRQEYMDLLDDDADEESIVVGEGDDKLDATEMEELPIDDLDESMPQSELEEIDAEFGSDDDIEEDDEDEEDPLY